MHMETTDTHNLRPQELEAVYAISRQVAQTVDIDRALDEIIRLTRSVFIFDNMVIYLTAGPGGLEPRYARVVGRGRSAEADLAWGETIAQSVVQSEQTLVHQESLENWEADRLSVRNFLGLPLRSSDGILGALVFGRFGGPAYTPEQIHLSEFIASHVAQLLNRQQLVARVASLEAERRLTRLQEDFIAMVSHELCTPLGFIKGYATTLLREDTHWDDATRQEFLTIIDEEADRLRELIDSLLDSSRLQSGTLHMEFQAVRLDTLLREIALRSRSRHTALDIHLDSPSAVMVLADPTRLGQVFDNLLTNAVKYAPGSPVTISIHENNDRCHIAVKDSGPGIAPEHLEHLFKRFYRVVNQDSGTRGTGLGLFICREIVYAHFGEITVESEIGAGTTFHITLPIFKPGTPSITHEEKTDERQNSNR